LPAELLVDILDQLDIDTVLSLARVNRRAAWAIIGYLTHNLDIQQAGARTT
jgi:hypothetical protein